MACHFQAAAYKPGQYYSYRAPNRASKGPILLGASPQDPQIVGLRPPNGLQRCPTSSKIEMGTISARVGPFRIKTSDACMGLNLGCCMALQLGPAGPALPTGPWDRPWDLPQDCHWPQDRPQGQALERPGIGVLSLHGFIKYVGIVIPSEALKA